MIFETVPNVQDAAKTIRSNLDYYSSAHISLIKVILKSTDPWNYLKLLKMMSTYARTTTPQYNNIKKEYRSNNEICAQKLKIDNFKFKTNMTLFHWSQI